jgi:ATPase family protein associated with various cellular activities (AAA)
METEIKKKEAINGHSIEDTLSWKLVLKGINLKDKTLSENYFKRASAIYFNLNKEIASIYAMTGESTRFNLYQLMEFVIKEFKLTDGQIVRAEDGVVGQNKKPLDQVLLLIRKNLFVTIEFTFKRDYVIFYSAETDKELIERIKELAAKCVKEPEPNYTHFLVEDSGRLSLRSFKMDNPPTGDILANYNDDFKEVDRIIQDRLQQTSKGIILLHSVPGCGKTTYIRYLISILKKRVIYIPSDNAKSLSSPEFLKFIMDYPDTILVIEDAEDIISERGHGGGFTISNLLNMTDGILSDCLRIQVICTFNYALANIDKALLRKGRLIARYEMGLLEIEKCREILKRLNVNALVTKKMTLADLYNMMDKDYGLAEPKAVGFKTSAK